MAITPVQKASSAPDHPRTWGWPLSIPPKVLEPVGRHFGVPDGVLNALVPEVVLQGPRVVAIVGEQRKSGIMRGIFCFRTPAQLHHRRYPARRASRRDRTEGRRGAGRAPPRARDRTRPSSRARPKHDVELRMESRTGDEKRAAVAGGSKGETGRCPGRCSSSALVGRRNSTAVRALPSAIRIEASCVPSRR